MQMIRGGRKVCWWEINGKRIRRLVRCHLDHAPSLAHKLTVDACCTLLLYIKRILHPDAVVKLRTPCNPRRWRTADKYYYSIINGMRSLVVCMAETQTYRLSFRTDALCHLRAHDLVVDLEQTPPRGRCVRAKQLRVAVVVSAMLLLYRGTLGMCSLSV